jgi:hypothetical protein
MLHGSIFLRYTAQNFNNDGKKGSDSKFSVPNWFMGMAQRQVGKNGLLNLRAMVSLDRIVDGGAGYPLLFQSGETWKGKPLIDRQHPHDLISELSVGYTQRINDKVDLTSMRVTRVNRPLDRLHLCIECRHSTILTPCSATTGRMLRILHSAW